MIAVFASNRYLLTVCSSSLLVNVYLKLQSYNSKIYTSGRVIANGVFPPLLVFPNEARVTNKKTENYSKAVTREKPQ